MILKYFEGNKYFELASVIFRQKVEFLCHAASRLWSDNRNSDEHENNATEKPSRMKDIHFSLPDVPVVLSVDNQSSSIIYMITKENEKCSHYFKY